MATTNPKVINLWSEPNYNSGWQVLAKWTIGLGVWVVIWFLIFIILYMVQSMLSQALQNNVASAGVTTVNPLLPLILIVIAFIATFIGNVMLAGVYNLFYSTKYYDLGKMFKYCKIFVNSFIWVSYSCDKVCWMVYHKLKDKSHG